MICGYSNGKNCNVCHCLNKKYPAPDGDINDGIARNMQAHQK